MVEARVKEAFAFYATATAEQVRRLRRRRRRQHAEDRRVGDTCLEDRAGGAAGVRLLPATAMSGRISVSRHLRDLNSARLMINNDRIRDNTARLLLLQPPQLGIG